MVLKDNIATPQAWQIHEYSGSSGLELAQEKLIPSISSPGDVLVKVHAASVNPIDVQMASGYGRNLINLYKNLVNQDIGSSEFPLTLGIFASDVLVSIDVIPADYSLLRAGGGMKRDGKSPLKGNKAIAISRVLTLNKM